MLLLVALSWTTPASAQELPPEPRAHEPVVRVGVRQRVPEVTLSAPGGLHLEGLDGGPLLEASRAVKIRPILPAPAGHLAVTEAGENPAVTLSVDRLRVVAREAGTPVELGKARYRGVLELRVESGMRLTVANVLPVEEYLRGVLPAEMSPSAPPEALKAQAVVARSFALAGRGRHRSGGFDLCDGTHCQVYGGASRESVATDRAIAGTRGQVLARAGKLVAAYYHAACGGATDSATDVWGGAADPLSLAGVADAPYPLGEDLAAEPSILSLALRGSEFFCGGAREFAWEFERTCRELEGTLARTLARALGKPVRLGRIRALVVAERTRSGRVRALEVKGSQGSAVVRGESIRWVFDSGRAGGPALPSTRFVVRPIREPSTPEAQPPERYRFYGLGSGHGVGLCQSGAMAMARLGCDYTRILAHYFPGATLGPMECGKP